MPLPTPLPLYVAKTESGAEVRARPDGAVQSTHDGVVVALNALLAHEAFQPKDGEGKARAPLFADGVWRWLDASAEEPEPAWDGTQVTREAIATMAARMNAQAGAVMIDGGSGDSAAHQSLYQTDTPANGWAHVAAEVLDASGRWHLYLRCELLPTVAADVEANRLAYGSILFAQSPDSLSDARLLSHALTNIPAVDGLEPAGSVRAMRTSRRTRSLMTTKNSARGAAADALTKLYAMFGLDPAADDVVWQLHDAVYALKSAAAAEKAVEALNGSGAAPAAPAAADATKRAARAVDGLEGAELETAATQLRDAARIALAMPEATLTQCAETLAAKAAEIAEAMAPDEEDSGEGAPAPEGEQTMSSETKTGADAAVRSRLDKLDADNAELRKQLAARDARDARRALEERITDAFRAGGMEIDASERSKLADAMGECSETAAARLLEVEVTVARSKMPPSGSLMGARQSPGSRGGATTDAGEAIELATKAVRSEQPDLRGPAFHKAVSARARKDHPAAFSRSAS